VMGAGNAFSGMFTQKPQPIQQQTSPAFSDYWNYDNSSQVQQSPFGNRGGR